MISSADFSPYLNIYLESIFNEEGISAINDGKITKEFRELLNNFRLNTESTQFDNGKIKYIQVPKKFIIDSKATIKMDLSNQYVGSFSMYVPEGLKWWYFIPYYGRSVIVEGGYVGNKKQTYLSRAFAGMIRSISPDFSELIPKISFEIADLLTLGIQQNTSYTIPSASVENQYLKFSIISAIYSKEFMNKNIFKELAPNIWTQKYFTNAHRVQCMKNRILIRTNKAQKDKEKSEENAKQVLRVDKLTAPSTLGSLLDIVVNNPKP